ncbi:lachesin-like isoform X2 [Tachypleus tridentatus]|uniref:lachesin-like isoform X2 n=1 Tax=Tachypleus tridentatus TaxID=6853 RepID=UPI003FD0DF8B
MTVTSWLATLITYLCLSKASSISTPEKTPQFADSVPNVTVPVGREACLVCTVDNLGNYKVAWIKLDTQTLLTIDTKVITRDNRIRSTNNNFRQWYLHIRDVQEDDRGYYMCQINTEPMISVRGFLDVLFPPTIQENGTSSDVMVNERSSVSLHCTASGYPQPKIFWRREDGRDINLGSFGTKSYSAAKVKGNFLNLTHVIRIHMGAYLCIASNGIPPSVSKRIILDVNFPPQIRVPNQVIGAIPGNDVILQCKVQAWPRPMTSWVRNEDTLLLASKKYQLTEVYDSYNVEMKLKINNLQREDFSSYKCGAKNSFGEKEGFIRLHDLHGPKKDSLPSQMIPNVPTTNSLTDKSRLFSSDKEVKGSADSLEGSVKMTKGVEDGKTTQLSDVALNSSNSSSAISTTPENIWILVWWVLHYCNLQL